MQWNTSSSTIDYTGGYYTTTVAVSGNTVGWNGQSLQYVPPPMGSTSPAAAKEGPLEWLHRRVDEMRVDLLAAA